MSAVPNTPADTVARVGASTPVGQTRWIERRASRLAVAYNLTQHDALQEAERDYWAFRGVGGLCDACETVSHCSRHGCIPLTPLPPRPSAAEAGATAKRWMWKLLLAGAAVLVLLSLQVRP